MNVLSLDDLVDRLNSGDPAAAEEAFVTYEPYLRQVVRRQMGPKLRAKFDSVDIVQSVCGDVLSAFRAGGMKFGTSNQLRAFLVRATRNRFIDRARQNRTALRLERPITDALVHSAPMSNQPRPSEAAIADELWSRLLSLSPPEHHAVLNLRKRGASASEIAARLGMHPGSVRRLLRELSIRLACDSDSQHLQQQ